LNEGVCAVTRPSVALGRLSSLGLKVPIIFGIAIVLLGCSNARIAAKTPVVPAQQIALTVPAPTETSAAHPAPVPATETPLRVSSPAPDVRATPSALPPETPATGTGVAPDLGSPLKTPAPVLRLALQPVLRGLDRPLFVTHAGDGSNRLFVVEKPGIMRIFANGNLVARPFLDLRDRVNSGSSERGLLGLAFPPDFAQRGYFFVNYTDANGNTAISRFKVTGDPNVADPASEFKVLGIRQPAANHNGGMLAFGPDGYLYIGMGDGGGAGDRFGNGQNPETLLGKMLRLDVTSDPSNPYLIPPDNPWAGGADWNGKKVRGEIWALGLRNPWRFSFDRRTGDLWLADVGQDKYEEIDLVHALEGKKLSGGLNFGWPIMEGMHCFPDSADCKREELIIPIAEYTHGDGCSVTGGYVYRGALFPALNGTYFYGDYCSGKIWALRPDGSGWHSTPVPDIPKVAISSFGEDQAGELYVTDLSGGAVYQLVQK
jgi:glucose/arabinose dehydrogenase